MGAKRLHSTLAAFSALAAVLCIGWAALIAAFQCLGWLRHAIWQPVPGYLVLLSQEHHDVHFRAYPGIPNALDLVPGLGNGLSPTLFGDKLAGAELIFQWFIGLPLTLHLIGLAIVFMSIPEASKPSESQR